MLSSNASNYKIQSKPSVIAKLLAMIILISSVIILISLWGIGWLSGFFLIIYFTAFSSLVYSLQTIPFYCSVSGTGKIEISEPELLTGIISGRSFYNTWVLFLCVDVTDKLLVNSEQLHNKPRKWFVVFNDSVAEKEYRLLARLIKSAP